ncbi:MAG: DUF4430 domain-containing protein [bacterium]
MKKNKQWFVAGGVLIVLVLVTTSMFAEVHRFQKTVPQSGAPISSTNDPLVSFEAGTVHLSLPFRAGETLYDAMTDAKNAGTLTFSGKEYSGLGYFVTSVGSLSEGNGKHLMYFINDKEASVGVSTYAPKNGDTIMWKLK